MGRGLPIRLTIRSHLVERAADAAPAVVEDLGVDHRGLHAAVSEQLLNGADVVATGQQLRGEGVAEGVKSSELADRGLLDGTAESPLDDRFVQVVAVTNTRLTVLVVRRGGEHVLPTPFAVGVGILLGQGIGEGRAAEAVVEITDMSRAHLGQVIRKLLDKGLGQQGDAVLLAIAVADVPGYLFYSSFPRATFVSVADSCLLHCVGTLCTMIGTA